ncbi:MAG TPA: hypothetical protein PLN69_09275 [bacterium]|nr:hypothetical protein [bacterium]
MSRFVNAHVVVPAVIALALACCSALASEQPGGTPAPGATITLPAQAEPAQTEYCAGYEEQETPPDEHQPARDNDWDDWGDDDEDDDDDEGGFLLFEPMSSIHIEFATTTAVMLDSGDGSSTEFKLVLVIKETDEYNIRSKPVKSASVYYMDSSDDGWNKLKLERQSRSKDALISSKSVRRKRKPLTRIKDVKHGYSYVYEKVEIPVRTPCVKEIWTGRIDIDRQDDPEKYQMIYFFRAESDHGNVTTEIPITSPGWPPAKDKFFPGVSDPDDPSDTVPDSLDMLDTFIACDGTYFYSALTLNGDVSAGKLDSYNSYSFRFMVSDSPHPDLLNDMNYIYAPSQYYNYRTFTAMTFISDESPGRIADFCFNYGPFTHEVNTFTAFGGNTLYSRVPVESVYNKNYQSIRAGAVTYRVSPAGYFSILPVNASPFISIYLRAHVLFPEKEIFDFPGTPESLVLHDPVHVIPGDNEYLDSIKDRNSLSTEQLISTQAEYKKWMQNFFDEPVTEGKHISGLFTGKGPFRVRPCDMVVHKKITVEIYSCDNHIKARILEKGKLAHTIMIGNDTKPHRDQQHIVGWYRIVLSDFQENPLSCNIEIR